jgi:hypothetical protein
VRLQSGRLQLQIWNRKESITREGRFENCESEKGGSKRAKDLNLTCEIVMFLERIDIGNILPATGVGAGGGVAATGAACAIGAGASSEGESEWTYEAKAATSARSSTVIIMGTPT